MKNSMLLDPHQLQHNLDRLEDIERASLRHVVQALYDYRQTVREVFQAEIDLVADVGEDITREALDRMGMARIDQRLFGKMDYKRACYLFHPDFAVKQALFVDSKAEKVEGRNTATLQTSQFSMVVRQIRAGATLEVAGKLPQIIELQGAAYLTTTLFVKYNYQETSQRRDLVDLTIIAVPNGMLQVRYNPTALDTIWLAGRNAPTLGEEFRVRLDLRRLKAKARWRVQQLAVSEEGFHWDE
jgi:hypothetical protein